MRERSWSVRRGVVERMAGFRGTLIFGAAACLAAWALAEIAVRPATRAAYAVAFSPDGERVAALSVTVGGPTGLLQVWDVATGWPVVSRVVPGKPLTLAFSPDGKGLATGDWDGAVTLYDPSDGKVLRSFSGLTTPVRGLRFAPDGRTIAAGASEGRVILWDSASGRERLRFDRGTALPVNSLAISDDGRLLAAAGGLRAGSTVVWDLETGLPLDRKSLRNLQEPLAFASNREFMGRDPSVSGGSLQLVDLDDGRVIASLPAPAARALAFSADRRLVASAGDDERVKVWEVATGRFVAAFDEHVRLNRPDPLGDNFRNQLVPIFGIEVLRSRNTVWSVAFSPDGTKVASASQDGSVWLRDLPGRGPSESTSWPLLQSPARPAWFAVVRAGLLAGASLLLISSFARKGRASGEPRPPAGGPPVVQSSTMS